MTTAAAAFTFSPTSVKAAIAATDGHRSEMWMVPRKMLRIVPGFNVRNLDSPDNKKHVDAIADSMAANGFLKDKPLAGYAGKDDKGKDCIFVTDGHCRMAALDRAAEHFGLNIDEVPVILKPPGTSEEDLLVAMAAGNTGKQLSPLEMAEVCKRLQGLNVATKDIAKRVGITPKYIGDLMTLLSAPAAIRNLVSKGKLSATEAVSQIKEKGAGAAPAIEEAAAKAEADGKAKVTRKQIDGEARKPREKKQKAEQPSALSVTQEFKFKSGQRVDMAKISAIKDLAEGNWWKLNEEAGKVDVLCDVSISVTSSKGPLAPPAEADDL